jgi:hypothetical protein
VESAHAVIRSVRRALSVPAIAFAALRAGAQAPSPSRYAEYRVDVIGGNGGTAQLGAGAVIPLGVYVRLGLDAAGGATWRDEASRASGRVDAIGRFLLDPFRESPLGLSLGGGLSVPYVDGQQRLRAYLTAVVDIEGRMRGRFTPAVQIGLGGGWRAGVVLRASPARWR